MKPAPAPPAAEFLSDFSRQHFQQVQQILKASSVPFKVNPNLVRGFDYYTGTVWEVTTSGLAHKTPSAAAEDMTTWSRAWAGGQRRASDSESDSNAF